nr:sensor histidine kinase [Photobacterium swingsii]
MNWNQMRWSQLNFRRRLLIIMTMSGLLELFVLSGAGFSYIKKWESTDLGEKAIGIAEYIAQTPEIIQAVELQDTKVLREGVERFRIAIGAAFIVVGDHQGVRLAHPIAERIGKPMRGGDNNKALKYGQSYISYAKGSMGHSVRGKTAIFDAQGNIIGVVSVGYLLTGIHDKLLPFLMFLIVMAIIVVIANGLLASMLAKRFQRALLGFEPEEISRLYAEQAAIMATIREGIVCIDNRGYLRAINRSACAMLGVDKASAIDKPIQQSLPDSRLERLLSTQQAEHDVELFLNGKEVVANREPLFQADKQIGAVASFRLKNEITELNLQLSKVTEYAELLRAQTHEHRNKLNTIAGLIQLGAYDDVCQFIGQESLHYQSLIGFLRDAITEPLIAGLLLGKSERARELGMTLVIDEGCHLERLPPHIAAEDIVTIVGNLIDNAFDATLSAKHTNGQVHIHISDYGQDIIIEVEDRGVGIPVGENADLWLQRGVSSKKKSNHGVGLYLVSQLMKKYGGQLEMENSATNVPLASEQVATGARFTLYLPKSEPSDACNTQV